MIFDAYDLVKEPDTDRRPQRYATDQPPQRYATDQPPQRYRYSSSSTLLSIGGEHRSSPLEFLLKKLIPSDRLDDAIGDLQEAYARKAERVGSQRAAIWYWKQVLLSIWHYASALPLRLRHMDLPAATRLRAFRNGFYAGVIGASGITGLLVWIAFRTQILHHLLLK